MKGDKIKVFYLFRKEDVSGISGIGIVALGAIFPSGKVELEWIATNHVSWGEFPNIDILKQLHGHEGKTEIIMGDPEDKPKKRKKKNEQ